MRILEDKDYKWIPKVFVRLKMPPYKDGHQFVSKYYRAGQNSGP